MFSIFAELHFADGPSALVSAAAAHWHQWLSSLTSRQTARLRMSLLSAVQGLEKGADCGLVMFSWSLIPTEVWICEYLTN